MNIAIIPARGGSKRIPRKNIKIFAGKPMIAHAILAARNSGLFDHVIVSTDDSEIAKIANDFGGETPFVRPLELSDDYTPTVPVIAHGIKTCESLGWNFDRICCIYPGVPFIQIGDIKTGLELLASTQADYCFPITEFPSAVQRALKRNTNGYLSPLYPEYTLTRTQDLELAYHDVGQFYWGQKQSWLTNQRIHSNAVGHIIPNWRVIDIDTLDDWKRAEILYASFFQKDLLNNKNTPF